MSRFFQDDKGNFSMMRLITFIGVIMSVVLTVWSMIQNLPNDYLGLIITWLGIATAGKVSQKFTENKNDNSRNK